jgi:hypothetical protein
MAWYEIVHHSHRLSHSKSRQRRHRGGAVRASDFGFTFDFNFPLFKPVRIANETL